MQLAACAMNTTVSHPPPHFFKGRDDAATPFLRQSLSLHLFMVRSSNHTLPPPPARLPVDVCSSQTPPSSSSSPPGTGLPPASSMSSACRRGVLMVAIGTRTRESLLLSTSLPHRSAIRRDRRPAPRRQRGSATFPHHRRGRKTSSARPPVSTAPSAATRVTNVTPAARCTLTRSTLQANATTLSSRRSFRGITWPMMQRQERGPKRGGRRPGGVDPPRWCRAHRQGSQRLLSSGATIERGGRRQTAYRHANDHDDTSGVQNLAIDIR